MQEINIGSDFNIKLEGRLDYKNASAILENIYKKLKNNFNQKIRIDLSQIEYLDDFGAVVLLDIQKKICSSGGSLQIINIPDHIQDILNLINFKNLQKLSPLPKHESPCFFSCLGEKTIKIMGDIRDMVIFSGDIVLTLGSLIIHPGRLRMQDTLVYMQRVGVDALPIVALISFLLGLIMAFMSAVQLQQFGANIYVASLVSLSMVRELGPIMTAIIVAGRSGSAFAAEIGSMITAEEVDALKTMGFDTTMFLVMPKLIAALSVVPLLVMFSDLFAIAGGLIVGVGMLDLTANAYIHQTMSTLNLFEITWGLTKSAFFAVLISCIGCFRGFQVRGGADAVGRATTSAVVTGIFTVILMDSIFAVILRYWG